MTKMKNSGIDWIGDIPEDWEIGKLKYSYDLFAGGDIREENFSVDYNETFCYPVLSNSKENHGIFGYSDIYRFDAGTVTVTGRGDIGYAEYREYEHFPIIRILVCVPRSILDGRFTAYWINSSVIEKNQTAVSQLTRFTLGELPLPKISFNEQTKIADYLDKKVAQLDKVKALLEAQIATLQDYRQSLIYETVTKGLDKTAPLKDSGVDWIGQIPEGWGIGRLDHYVTIHGRIGFRGYTTDDIVYEGEGAISLSPSNIIGMEVKDNNNTYITWTKYEESPEIKVSKGDVVYVKTGSSYGKAGLVKTLGEKATINPQLVILKPRECVDSRYINYLLNSRLGKDQSELIVGGSTIPTISQENLRKIGLPLVNHNIQQELANFLDKKLKLVEDSIEVKKQQIDNINQQRQTLIYDFVTGKRRV